MRTKHPLGAAQGQLEPDSDSTSGCLSPDEGFGWACLAPLTTPSGDFVFSHPLAVLFP